MKNIAVFYGGVSVEHDVSVITGVMTVNSLDKKRFNAFPVYVDGNGEWFTGEILKDPDVYKNLNYKKLKRVTFVAGENALYVKNGKKLKLLCKVYCAINCLHGERGEDGSLVGIFNMCDIPCASPSIYSSAVAMDKTLTKAALKGVNVKTLPFIVARSFDKPKTPDFGFPVVVKPVCGGSSIGVSVAETEEDLKRAVDYALKFGEKAVIEPCLKDFTEINCAAYKKAGKIRVSACERPVGRTEILTFSDKYEGGKRVFPADIDPTFAAKIRSITEKVYKTFGFSGVIRIDYFLKDGKIYLNEINSVPGSLAYYLFSDSLSGFTVMLNELIETAISEFAERSELQRKFDSGILSFSGAKGSKRL